MLFKSLTHLIYQVSGKVPLHIILVVPFVLQIVGAVGVVGYLSFRNGQRAVNEVATQLLQEVNARVEQNLEAYLTVPHQVNQINAAAINLGQLNLQDIPGLERHFWQQIQIFDILTFAGLGLENKDNLGAERFDNDTLTLRVSTKASNHIFYTYATNELGERQEILSSIKFDPRTRPWYKAAVAAGKPIWSEIYPNTAGITAYLGASMPFYDQQQKLQGVLLTNINLSQISRFLRSLKIGKTGQIFIIERSGMLVATSTGEKPFRTLQKEYGAERVPAIDSSNTLTKATTQYLTAQFHQNQQIQSLQQLEFTLEGKRQFVQVQPFQDEFGLDWFIVVVVPEVDFMEQINANTRTTIWLCLLALLIAIGVGILTARWIVQPILRLKEAATALSQGQFDSYVNLERADELGVLAGAFNRMALQLQESFTNLEGKNTELRRLSQLKDEFLANTSHELRTPLNGIIGIAESLIDGATGKLSEKTNFNLVMIVTSGKRLATLVNDILDFSQLRHQNLQLQIQPVGVREIVDVVLTLSQSLIGNKPLQLLNSISVDTPLVAADENRLQQIFYNLIGNAIKFTESGIIEVSAQLVTEEQEAEVAQSAMLEITVADTGIGIPADKLERIFESFEQGDGSTARKYGGTGLGLAVTKQLVELHGGTIQVASTVGQGSQFKFTLPVSQQQVKSSSESSPIISIIQTPTLTAETTIKTPALTSDSGDFQILIVDDEPINLQVLSNNLALENYAITQATSGVEALAIIEQGFQPDLILLDVMMPRMTGYEVSEKLREQFLPSELPIVMLTAKNQDSDLVEGFNSGANDYLSKPFNKNELLARIKIHMRLAKINAAYGRFVPHDFLHFLGQESIIDVKLGDHVQQEMTILFSDIRSFTSLSEGMSPQENFNFINSYLSQVSPVIRAHNGFIDKYIGDAIMALFPESADDAVQGAITMQEQVALYNQYRHNSGYLPIAIGIGLHTGSLMLGTIGEQERMESTVISDAVNLASRLEGLTKLYGARIIISEATLSELHNVPQYSYRYLDRVKVKGKKLAVAIFEICNGDPERLKELKMKTKTRFEEAVFLCHNQEFAAAQQIFEEILQKNPQDKAALLHIKHCQKYQQYGMAENWEFRI
ncbi:MAG: response regulator [Symploca sp. SIO2G7]|nr:response regulator [Symploca sp. SIO2G7]